MRAINLPVVIMPRRGAIFCVIYMNKEDIIKELKISPIIQIDGRTIDISDTLYIVLELIKKRKKDVTVVEK